MSIPPIEAERFVRWLEAQVIADARGDRVASLAIRPADRLWLGRVASEDSAWQLAMGERGRRLDPCAVGFRFQPLSWDWTCRVEFVVWRREQSGGEPVWVKSERGTASFPLLVPPAETASPLSFGRTQLADAAQAIGAEGHTSRVDVSVENDRGQLVAEVTFVNDSPEKRGHDTNFYEVVLEVEVGQIVPIELDALPDSFRYDRRVPAMGVYGGVEYERGTIRTTDYASADRLRPEYWDDRLGPEPDLAFDTLAMDPIAPLEHLVDSLAAWGDEYWSGTALTALAASESWSDEMLAHAHDEAAKFVAEVDHCRRGLELLKHDALVREAFVLTNEAFKHSGRNRYSGWRPFQLGFLLTVLASLVDPDSERREVVDTLWFATGGGKTETYLALVVLLTLHDRLRGKAHGISAWSRFPLRMLSLQQTQRFADALAGAELARRRKGIEGDVIALGFLVGGPPNGTPNRVRDDSDDPASDARNRDMPERHRVLLRCPFCFSDEHDLSMRFDRASWRLLHICPNPNCPWPETGLPFHVVDEEIYRLLPSVVIGTLDKAASISLQAANRGLYASPIARCQGPGHGFTYAPRSTTPKGCLVPGCTFGLAVLGQELKLFAPSLRVQDELHLLRDSLGAVDSHYETLLDHLYRATFSPLAKVVASSATLAGYEHQVNTLYKREGAVFPLPGPKTGVSFWTQDGPSLARRFLGLAPRGVTLEFANDRLAESLQRAVRRLISEPQEVCREADIDVVHARDLLDYYGVHVCYGTKIRDIEAAARSFETQPGVAPMNASTLTGRNTLEEVRSTLARIDEPEQDFNDRLHVICASSMMSHGVDVDRFNVMTLLGLPLGTAEFIQATARIGRKHPGLVVVLHRMGVERDASVFRSFPTYVLHGDRFVEPIAITRRSRRVLEYTFAGLFTARVLGIHEARSVRDSKKQLTTVRALRDYFTGRPVLEEDEFKALADALGLTQEADGPLADELTRQLRVTYHELLDPATKARFPGELPLRPPMMSMREVESQVPVYGSEADT